MIANLTALAIMVAAVLFALSLPFSESEAARALRRAAGFAFAMAFVPAIVVSALSPLFASEGARGSIQSFLAICGALAILGVFALAAYGFLEIRSHARSRQPSAHAERLHYVKRRPRAEEDEDENE